MPSHKPVDHVVEMIRSVASSRGRAALGSYAIEGIRLHERALRAGIRPTYTLVGTVAEHEPRVSATLDLIRALSTTVFTLPDEALAELTGGRTLGGILSLAPLPARVSAEELVQLKNTPLLLVLDSIVDPGNIGALIRTAHAFGVDGVVLVGDGDPYHPRALRTSMGSIFRASIANASSFDLLQELLKPLGIPLAGAVTGGGAALPDHRFSPMGAAIVVGNEFHGLPQATVDQLDHRITIPMYDAIDSLSVNAAAAVMLYEYRRQHPLPES